MRAVVTHSADVVDVDLVEVSHLTRPFIGFLIRQGQLSQVDELWRVSAYASILRFVVAVVLCCCCAVVYEIYVCLCHGCGHVVGGGPDLSHGGGGLLSRMNP